MSSKTTNLTRFIHWFVIPFNTLRTIPGGDAAFVAFSIGCALCERYHRSIKTSIGTMIDLWHGHLKHLDVDSAFFKRLLGRVPQRHPNTKPKPKWRKRRRWRKEKPYRWEIDGKFKLLPTICLTPENQSVICIDPYAFSTQHYIDLS